MIGRRSLLAGFASLLAAPSIVRVGSLMPVKAWNPEPSYWINVDGLLIGWPEGEPEVLFFDAILADHLEQHIWEANREKSMRMMGLDPDQPLYLV